MEWYSVSHEKRKDEKIHVGIFVVRAACAEVAVKEIEKYLNKEVSKYQGDGQNNSCQSMADVLDIDLDLGEFMPPVQLNGEGKNYDTCR